MPFRSPVVAGLDGSRRDLDTLALARRFTRLLATRLLAVHVYPGPEAPPFEGDSPERARAEARLENACRAVAGVELEQRALPGRSPARVLQRVAADEDAALLVVSASHHGALGRIAPGSVPERILSGSTVAVAVAPLGHWDVDLRPRHVGSAFSDDGAGRRATELAAAIAVRNHATLELIALGDARDIDLHRALVSAAARYRDLDVVTTLASGSPPEELAEATMHLDLLVTGPQANGRLVRHSNCPLLVLPAGAAAPLLEALGAQLTH